MSKKIKIIDLLNKIANGEEMPKEIKVQKKIFRWNEFRFYEDDNGQSLVENWLNTTNKLTEEVEIVEIEELPNDIDEFGWLEVKDKINELVKAINGMRKDINK